MAPKKHMTEEDRLQIENRRRETICRICKQPSRKKRRKRIISL